MSISHTSIVAARKFDEVKGLYEWHDHRHCVAVLTVDYPELLSEICDVLLAFRFTEGQVKTPGGSESQIPKSFSGMLRPRGWKVSKVKPDSSSRWLRENRRSRTESATSRRRQAQTSSFPKSGWPGGTSGRK